MSVRANDLVALADTCLMSWWMLVAASTYKTVKTACVLAPNPMTDVLYGAGPHSAATL